MGVVGAADEVDGDVMEDVVGEGWETEEGTDVGTTNIDSGGKLIMGDSVGLPGTGTRQEGATAGTH